VIPNSVFKVKSERRKVFVGDQIDECKDYSGLFYVLPFQKVVVDDFVLRLGDIKRGHCSNIVQETRMLKLFYEDSVEKLIRCVLHVILASSLVVQPRAWI
jgi:hypothetical protein